MVSADDGGGTDLGLSLTRVAKLLVRFEDEERARAVLRDAGVLEEEVG